jgi:Transcriptional regulator, AbiEi antitoxin
MKQKDIILHKLRENTMVRYRDLKDLGVSPITLMRLVKDGLVVEVNKGFYTLPNSESPSVFQGITKVYPNAVFCMLTAQRFHGLVDTPDLYYTIALPRDSYGRSSRNIPGVETLKIISWNNPLYYKEGVECIHVDGAEINITNKWRTVADMLRPKNKQEREEAHKAIILIAQQEGREGLNKIATYARRLGFMQAAANQTSLLADYVESSNAYT